MRRSFFSNLRATGATENIEPAGEDWKLATLLPSDDKYRIESLLDIPHQDRNRAFDLKSKLNRLDAFEDYEDQFQSQFKILSNFQTQVVQDVA